MADLKNTYITLKLGNGGGSGSGVTPQDVQAQINSALTPYWESGETKDYVDGAVSGISLEGYATSGDMQSAFTLISETQSAITAVEDHLFDVEQVTASALTELHDGLLEVSGRTVDMSDYWTSAQTEEAITSKNYVTSAQVETQMVAKNYITSAETANFVTSTQVETQILEKNYVTSAQVETQIEAKNYVNSGDVKSQVEAYNYATVSQIPTVPTSNTAFTNDAGYITDAAIENLVTSAQVETQIDTKAASYTPTSGFSTINGSAITNGGNLVIQGGADLSAYYTSAQTEEAISAATSGKADAANVTANHFENFPTWNEQGIITGTTGNTFKEDRFYVNNGSFIIPHAARDETPPHFYAPVSAGTAGDILVSTGNGAPVWTTDNKVSSASVSTIWKGTQAQYDAITTKDPNTFYIIVSN